MVAVYFTFITNDCYIYFSTLRTDGIIAKARFPLPELTSRVDGWPVSITRQHGPCRRVMETGHPSTRVVETGLNCKLMHSVGAGMIISHYYHNCNHSEQRLQ